jgi:hypothetical protein
MALYLLIKENNPINASGDEVKRKRSSVDEVFRVYNVIVGRCYS